MKKKFFCKLICFLLGITLLVLNIPILVSSMDLENSNIALIAGNKDSDVNQQNDNSKIELSSYTYFLGDYYIHNFYSGKVLRNQNNSSLSLYNFLDHDKLHWYFEYLGNDRYYIKSTYNTDYALCDSNGTVRLTIFPSSPSDEFIWEIQPSVSKGYIIKNKYSQKVLKYYLEEDDTPRVTMINMPSTTDPNYEQILWDVIFEDDYIGVSSINIIGAEWLDINSSQASIINVTPSNATYKSADCFLWHSDNTTVATVDNLGVVTGKSNGSAKITAINKQNGLAYTYTVTVGQLISNGSYYIQNKYSNLFIDIFGSSTSDSVVMQQNEYMDQNQEKWMLQYLGAGYYLIRSLHSNKYLSVYNSSSDENELIIQSSTLTDAGKWKITQTLSGAYKFTAKCSEAFDRVLAISMNSQYSSILQMDYTHDATLYSINIDQYNDEWNLYAVDYMLSNDIGITNYAEYYIMNVENNCYLGVDENDSSITSNVTVSVKSDTSAQKWELQLNDSVNKEYKVISSYSMSDEILNVINNIIDIGVDNNLDCQQFVIKRINWKPYEGTYIIQYDNKYMSIDINNNVVLNTEFDNNAVWSLMRTEKGDVDLFNFNYTIDSSTFNTTANSLESQSLFESLGYTHYVFTNYPATTAYNYIQVDDVFIFRGHGGPGLIEFHNSDGAVNGYMYASSDNLKPNSGYLGSLPNNTLSDLRCALFLGCSTARTSSNGNNLIETTYIKGAHFALGTLDTTITSNSDAFLQYFLEAISTNKNIKEAIQYAIIKVGETVFLPTYGCTGYYPIYYIGDIYQTLN